MIEKDDPLVENVDLNEDRYFEARATDAKAAYELVHLEQQARGLPLTILVATRDRSTLEYCVVVEFSDTPITPSAAYSVNSPLKTFHLVERLNTEQHNLRHFLKQEGLLVAVQETGFREDAIEYFLQTELKSLNSKLGLAAAVSKVGLEQTALFYGFDVPEMLGRYFTEKEAQTLTASENKFSRKETYTSKAIIDSIGRRGLEATIALSGKSEDELLDDEWVYLKFMEIEQQKVITELIQDGLQKNTLERIS